MIRQWWARRRARDAERERLAAEVADELHFHVEGRVEELVSAGWTEDAARAEAVRRFGDLERIGAACTALGAERVTRERWLARMATLLQDVRYGARVLRRNPGFTAIAVATLGLGIGATAAIFAVVDAVLLRPLPFFEPDRLVVVWERNESQGIERDFPSPPNFLDWRAESRSFAGMAAWSDVSVTLTGRGQAEVLPTIATTWDFFRVLGVDPELGRTFAEGEGAAGGGRMVVLSYGTWQRLFGGSPDALGATLLLDSEPYEVVGVMPASFRTPRANTALWVARDYADEHRQSRYLNVVARLGRGVTTAQAAAELDLVAARLAERYPEADEGWRTRLVPAREEIVGDARAALVTVSCAVGFVLLLACVNVANLVLGRSMSRQGELALRAALGASARRLRQQLVAESAMLGLAGGAAGALVAYAAVHVFLSLAPDALPRAAEIVVDARVLAFALVVALVTGCLFGLLPAVRSARSRLSPALAEVGTRVAGRGREATRRGLIVAEVALSAVLLVGAGLAGRSLLRLGAVDPGYRTADVRVARINLDPARYDKAADRVLYFERLVERLVQVPGVERAAVTSTLPLDPAGIDFDLPYHAEGQPPAREQDVSQADYRIVSAGFFEALGIPLLRGRVFTARDRAGSRPAVIINRTFAERVWPGQDPVGKHITILYVSDRESEVVGVVGNTRHTGLAQAPVPQMFVPLGQAEVLFGYMQLALRTNANAPGIETRIRDAALEVDPSQPLYEMNTMAVLRADATASQRLAALVFGLFAVLALTLSAVGIHGVVSYQVARRTREIGVRMALGAPRARVLAGILREAALLAAVGIGLGLVIAAGATRAVRGLLYGIQATDPVTFTGVPILLFVLTILAALLPALRAAGIDPVRAMRAD